MSPFGTGVESPAGREASPGIFQFIEFIEFVGFRYNINPLDWNRVAIGNWK